MESREIKLFILIMSDTGKVCIQPIVDEEGPQGAFEGFFTGIGLQALLRKGRMKNYPSLRTAFTQCLVPEAKKLKKGWKHSFFSRIQKLRKAIQEAWKE